MIPPSKFKPMKSSYTNSINFKKHQKHHKNDNTYRANKTKKHISFTTFLSENSKTSCSSYRSIYCYIAQYYNEKSKQNIQVKLDLKIQDY